MKSYFYSTLSPKFYPNISILKGQLLITVTSLCNAIVYTTIFLNFNHLWCHSSNCETRLMMSQLITGLVPFPCHWKQWIGNCLTCNYFIRQSVIYFSTLTQVSLNVLLSDSLEYFLQPGVTQQRKYLGMVKGKWKRVPHEKRKCRKWDIWKFVWIGPLKTISFSLLLGESL